MPQVSLVVREIVVTRALLDLRVIPASLVIQEDLEPLVPQVSLVSRETVVTLDGMVSLDRSDSQVLKALTVSLE